MRAASHAALQCLTAEAPDEEESHMSHAHAHTIETLVYTTGEERTAVHNQNQKTKTTTLRDKINKLVSFTEWRRKTVVIKSGRLLRRLWPTVSLVNWKQMGNMAV